MNHSWPLRAAALNHEKGEQLFMATLDVRYGEAPLNHELGGLYPAATGGNVFGSRGKWVDLRNGEEEIPADDEPDPAKVIVP